VGAPKFRRNFDPSVAEVVRTVGKSEDSIKKQGQI